MVLRKLSKFIKIIENRKILYSKLDKRHKKIYNLSFINQWNRIFIHNLIDDEILLTPNYKAEFDEI